MLRVECLTLNPWEENTYIVYDTTKQAAIVDCGCFTKDEQTLLLAKIKDLNLTITHVLQTHLHLDHIFGYSFVYKTFGLKAYAHKEDEFLLNDLQNYALKFGIEIKEKQPEIGTYINEGELIKVGNTKLECIHVPGHSPGGICFYAKEDKTLISGDCIFREGIGRTDLMRGNHHDLITNLQQKILTLPDDVKIFPGHGPSTTVKHEKEFNPFL